MHRLFSALVFAVSALALFAARGQAQEQSARIVFPYAPGGAGDGLARLLAEQLRASLGRNVIVENVTGGGGRIGVLAVKNAAPDGATLLLAPIAPICVFPHIYPQLGYDPLVDFQPISQVATFDLALAVGPQTPAKSLGELVTWLKANPTQGNFGSPGAGTLAHFAALEFARVSGLDLRHVAYRGTPAALVDLLGGRIPIVVSATSELLHMHKEGRIRILATSGPARSPFVSDAPTFTEAGHSFKAEAWYGIYAPAKTPADVTKRLSNAIATPIQTADIKSRILALGFQPTGTSPEALARIQRADFELWGPIVKASRFAPSD